MKFHDLKNATVGNIMGNMVQTPGHAAPVMLGYSPVTLGPRLTCRLLQLLSAVAAELTAALMGLEFHSAYCLILYAIRWLLIVAPLPIMLCVMSVLDVLHFTYMILLLGKPLKWIAES